MKSAAGAGPRRRGEGGALRRGLRTLGPLLPLLLFGLALAVLHHELRDLHYDRLAAYVRGLPPARIALAVALTGASYATLTLYDLLGFVYAGRRLPYRRTALAAFIGYAFSNTIGHALLTGAPLRFRLYSAWGVSAEQITKVVAFGYLTFWLGFFALAGTIFSVVPKPLPAASWLPFASERPLGAMLLAAVAVFLIASLRLRGTWTLRGWELRLPRPRLVLAQIAVASVDLVIAAGALWALLPDLGSLSFSGFLGFYLLAQVAGILSQVPGGLGVLETVLLLLLKPWADSAGVAGGLIGFRIVYYLLPLALATALVGVHELRRQRALWGRAVGVVERWGPEVVPQALAVTTFLGGAFLLFSGATPPDTARYAWFHRWVGLPVIEISHFLGSVIGGGLMVLARGLQKRLLSAFHLAVGLLAAGTAAALLRGLDVPTALTLAVLLAVALPCRSVFDRRATFEQTRWTPAWTASVLLVLVTAGWLTLFSFEHVAYSHDLWWRFALDAHAPRSLRALVGGAGILLLLMVYRLLRPAPPPAATAAREDLERAELIAQRSPRTYAYLALTGDKRLLFHEAGDALLMYAVEGRSWVSMGDPVGPPRQADELAWRLRELAERWDGWAVFYQVGREHLPRYVELGLGLLELGEEGRVPLAEFSLAGSARAGLRQAHRRAARTGVEMEVVPSPGVAALLDELRVVSEAWLAERNTREKGFSLGFFEPRYLERLPVAVVRHQGRIVAFANLWPGAGRAELSIDLMRHLPDAPGGLMDFLFVELMLWASGEGYRWFNLGMAPLAGLDAAEGASLWNRLGSLVFHHGEHFYNFQGLRAFKDKFEPLWEPRYLAAPGGLALPQVLTNLATLISGGPRGLLAR